MDEKQKVLDILNKFSFILGQRAGRELWFDKPEKVQDEDLSNFNEDIEHIKHYIKNTSQFVWHKVVDEEYPDSTDNVIIAYKVKGEDETYVGTAFCVGNQWFGAQCLYATPEVIAWAEFPKYED